MSYLILALVILNLIWVRRNRKMYEQETAELKWEIRKLRAEVDLLTNNSN